MAEVKVDIPWGLFQEEVSACVSKAVRAIAVEVGVEASEAIRSRIPAHERTTKRGGKRTTRVVTDLIDTGALRASGYLVTGEGESDRGRAIAEAESANPGVEIGTPDELPQGPLQAQWNYAASYAAYTEAMYAWLIDAADRAEQKREHIMETELAKAGF